MRIKKDKEKNRSINDYESSVIRRGEQKRERERKFQKIKHSSDSDEMNMRIVNNIIIHSKQSLILFD